MVESVSVEQNSTAAPAAAIILAGGSGTRLERHDNLNKVYLELAGRPIIAWSLATLASHPAVNRLVLVIRPGDETDAEEAIETAQIEARTTVVHGGKTRTDSEQAGLAALANDIATGMISTVLIHDGARPFIDVDLVERLLAGVRKHGAAIPAVAFDQPVVDITSENLVLVDTKRWVRVQTPQAFNASALLLAYNKARQANRSGFDTAELVRWAGGPSALVVVGSQTNLKVTTPTDLKWAQAHAANRL